MPPPFRRRSGHGASAPSSRSRRLLLRPGRRLWPTPPPPRQPRLSRPRPLRRWWRRTSRWQASRRQPRPSRPLSPRRLPLRLSPRCSHLSQSPRWDRSRRRRFTSAISSPSSCRRTITSSGARRFFRFLGVTTCLAMSTTLSLALLR